MTTRTTLSAGTALLTITALFAGCASGESNNPPAEAAAPVGTVETMFGTVEVPPPADGDLTVVALGWSDAETALSLGVVPVAVFDWQGFGADNKGVGPWATDLFGDVTPDIIERGDESLNYEQIQALDPDLILNTRSGNDEAEFDRLSEIAPTVYGPEGAGAYATEWRDQLALVGDATGHSAAAGALVDEIQGGIDSVAEANPQFDGLTAASVAKFGDAYGAYLPGDGRFDILEEIGFVENPPITALEPNGFFTNVSAENVAVLDADIAVVLPIGFTLDETQSDVLLSSLAVASDDRAVYLDPDSELSGAWGASSPLSIPVVLDQLTPMLAEAASRL